MINISATNRGSKRIDSDFYATPISAIENLLHNHIIKEGNILECSAGNGNIVKTIFKYNSHMLETQYLDAVEIRCEEKEQLEHWANKVYIQDFLNFQPERKYKTIISNPPYSLAQEIIEKCFEITDENTEIIMLLRTAFLESKKRYNFWQKHPLNGLYVLSQRPSFTGKGTDATSYAWFVWNGSDKQEIKVI